jgi:hypothetical protein
MLGGYLSHLAEDHWCASWLRGLEYEVWEALQNPEYECGFSALSPEELATLRWLSESCGGWVQWSDERQAPVFVDLGAWRQMVEKRQAVA